jgi:U3 small nucleolar RNA-associated protein 14
VKAGWGDWAGPGQMVVSTKIQRIRDRKLEEINTAELAKKEGRKDKKMPHVMISERRVKQASKYCKCSRCYHIY